MPQGRHKDFARRLNTAWDFAGFPRARRRIGAIAEHYNVSRETARKWCQGLAIPKYERLSVMAVQMGISSEWLSTGRGAMESNDLGIREGATKYDNAEEVRLVGLVRKLTRRRQRALLQLLEEEH
ncbi:MULTISPECIES: hypothetical protein [unclassified Lysobacter]|uniref:hypothetical protein n=1 Tax=unclassified Lysobacter TaxID=2635362 RepID=UPI001C23D9FD|nr:hypothetical protein [Lysobacter sp. MMG2]MBU8977974.1 hypothetical protein [Lysobacter sp. MMG2]